MQNIVSHKNEVQVKHRMLFYRILIIGELSSHALDQHTTAIIWVVQRCQRATAVRGLIPDIQQERESSLEVRQKIWIIHCHKKSTFNVK